MKKLLPLILLILVSCSKDKETVSSGGTQTNHNPTYPTTYYPSNNNGQFNQQLRSRFSQTEVDGVWESQGRSDVVDTITIGNDGISRVFSWHRECKGTFLGIPGKKYTEKMTIINSINTGLKSIILDRRLKSSVCGLDSETKHFTYSLTGGALTLRDAHTGVFVQRFRRVR